MGFKGDLTWGGFGLRLLLALLLVLATFNPTGVSWFHWVITPMVQAPTAALGTLNPYKVLAGIVLAIGWVLYLQATQRSLGVLGAVLLMGVLGCLVWLFAYWGLFRPASSTAIAWIVLLVLSIVLGVGMSWSHVSRAMSGQVDTDQVA